MTSSFNLIDNAMNNNDGNAMNNNDDVDDKNQSLRELSKRYRSSIVSQLVDIGSESNQQRHIKFRSFIHHLKCLQPTGTQLRRVCIDGYRQPLYVALSYTWIPSGYEDPYDGLYHVEAWDGNRLEPSQVRNCVLDRVLKYMRHLNIQFLWIDAHCIRQDTCVGNCTGHAHCAEKRDALQAMDLVYQRSKHPVALLARPLQIASELCLLVRILRGTLVDDNGDRIFQLSRATTVCEAKKALWLLREITRDIWWGRAWTFQENYRGGERMRLLIRHHPSLEQQKLDYGIFGDLPGELCVWSVTFSIEATRLCLALRSATGLPPDDICRIADVLRAAGRYTIILNESSPMSPTIIADLEARGLSEPWDRLAIIANCCKYTVRLNAEAPRRPRRSLSLSVLAMCILNGEILDNNDESRDLGDSLTTSNFLKERLFKGFSAPEDETRQLTFNKGCRLSGVKLTEAGISTKGHMWKLGRVVDTAAFGRKLPWISNPMGRLTLNQRKRLLQLVIHLRELGHYPLANYIDQYLATDAEANASEDYASFTDMYLHRMAVELAQAIQSRQKLRLGSIWEQNEQPTPYLAAFVWPGRDDDETRSPPTFVFTSAWSRDMDSASYDANDIDRHVSLEVGVEEATGSPGIPRLRVQRWLLGMCFFYRYPLTEVVFPWPQALHTVYGGGGSY